ncbi:hypothetical protein NGB36_19540 [Streptomyces sp. RB6PN25]|uniref:Cellulose synthase n=1 Tax=Streptomyces humicola TaxID=2953240 RepID=A0ABT1PYK7_9ACTN|nr:hypothetical protein [Streptomyces humicola]MCQ4082737.1 hypothetical protein [Streptomyces humicola]
MLTETVCVALSGAGLAVALLTAWRRRFLRATRIAAVALLPVGLYMTGLITLGSRVGEAIGSWGAGLVLKPTVWAGFAVLAVAVVLYVVTRFAAARGGGKAVEGGAASRAVAPTTSAPAIGAGGKAVERQPKERKGSGAADDGLSDLGDIEEILRKHGI